MAKQPMQHDTDTADQRHVEASDDEVLTIAAQIIEADAELLRRLA